MPSPPPQTFDALPILPLAQALDPATKPKFLSDLRHALLNVGFLYLSETGLPEQLVRDVIRECRGFFKDLPLAEKEKIEMKNEKSFLGWSRVSDFSIPFFCSLLDSRMGYECVCISRVYNAWSIATSTRMQRWKNKCKDADMRTNTHKKGKKHA
jgi:hypothetical protein